MTSLWTVLKTVIAIFPLVALAAPPENLPTGPHNETAILLQGGTYITYNEQAGTLEPMEGSLLIINNTIAQIAPVIDNIPEHAEIINITGRIISPGFVDTHRHGWQTAFRTQAGNVTLGTYYYTFGEFGASPLLMEPEDVYIGQLMGLYEAINAGVTSILDHAHHTWSNATSQAGLQASIDSGNRVWWCYTVHPVVNHTNPYTVDNTAWTWQFEQMKEMSTKAPFANGKVNLGFAYDGLQGTKETIVNTINFVRNLNVSVMTTHYVGGFFQPGLHAVELLNEYDLLDIETPWVFSHASGLTLNEARLLRESNQYISMTSESELHYGHGHPRSYEIQDQGALGIDTHFTFSTDIITQMRMNLQTVRMTEYTKTLEMSALSNNTPMSVNQAFLMGTRNGGLALRRPDIGVLKVGAKADIVIFNADGPNLIGWKDPVAAIVLHSNVGDIEHVIVDGQFKKRDGKLVGVDWPTLSKQFLQSQDKIIAGMYAANWSDFRNGLNTQLTGWPNQLWTDNQIVDTTRGPDTGYSGGSGYNFLGPAPSPDVQPLD